MKLSPKLLKNLYDLRHERYLQKCHSICNIGAGTLLAFLGITAAYIIDGKNRFTDLMLEFILFGSCIIISLSYFLYKITRSYRYDTIKKIKQLNEHSAEL